MKCSSLLRRSLLLGATLVCAGSAQAQHQYWTAPYGPGGSWNLYEVVTVVATWDAADAAAKIRPASATGLASMTGNGTLGHLVAISSFDENTFVAAAASLTPGSGNNNIWLGLTDRNVEMGSSKTGWEWSGTGTPDDILDVGEYHAWFGAEPNNSGDEDATEMRTDGWWNDNKINAATTRKYVIEYEINSATAIPDTRQFPVWYSAPFGPGGTYHLYRVSFQGDTFTNAHNIATTMTADSTGIAGVAGNFATGHLSTITSSAENDFIYQLCGCSVGLNAWAGATDDVAFGGTEAGSSKTTGWVWAGSTEPFTYQKFSSRPYIAAGVEPNNSGGAENFVEIANTSFWNDLAHGTNMRRYVIEWDINSATPITGATRKPCPILGSTPPTLNAPAVGTWAARDIRGTGVVIGNILNAAQNALFPPGTAVLAEGTRPVLNFNDIDTTTAFAGRGNGGVIYQDDPLISDTVGAEDNNFVVVARTKINLPGTGPYTLNIHSDDGFALRVIGSKVLHAGGLGSVDCSSFEGVYTLNGGADTNTRMAFTVPAAGDYDLEYIAWEGTGGCFGEVSWAEGDFSEDWETSWTLVGGPVVGTPLLPEFDTMGVPAAAGPVWQSKYASGGTVAATTTMRSLLVDAIADYLIAATTGTTTFPVLNYFDPENPGNNYLFAGETPVPGNTTADNNNYGVASRASIPFTAGVYTFNIRADDTFALRIKNGAQIRSRISIVSNGSVDPYDPTTFLWWQGGGDSNCKMVVNFPTTQSYEFDFFHFDGTGGSSAEISWKPGVVTEDIPSAGWTLLGDTSALAPLVPATLAGAGGETGLWSFHRVSGVGTMTTVLQAGNALNNLGAGTHTTGSGAAFNMVDSGNPGTGGLFTGDSYMPGDILNTNEDDFAIVGKCNIYIPTAGLYTISVKHSDGFAMRFPGKNWNTFGKSNAGLAATFDPLDPTVMVTNWNGTTKADEVISRATINLPAGINPFEIVSFDRSAGWNIEVWGRQGDFAGTAEYALPTGGVANDGTATINGPWRLIGHQPLLSVSTLGVDSWFMSQSPTMAAAPAAPWDPTGAWNWLQGAGAGTVVTASRNQVNTRDPNNGGPGSVLNDQPNLNDTAADDQNYATSFTANLLVPESGLYCVGWQGDDGGFFEFLSPSTAQFSRIVSNASTSGTAAAIQNSTDGTVNGRLHSLGGGGNTRTMGEIFLTAGSHPIRVFWYEGTGGSYWEILAGPAGGDATMASLITTTSGTSVADVAGLQIVGNTIDLVSAGKTPANEFTFTWKSLSGVSYKVERSSTLQGPWQEVMPPTPASGSTMTYTSPPLLPGEPRYFYHAVLVAP